VTCKWYSLCPLRELEREGNIGDKWKKEYCGTEENWKNCKRYQMEEEGEFHSYNMMPNGSIKKLG